MLNKIILLYFILIFSFSSCVTTKINTRSKNDYTVLKENKKYIIKTKSMGTIRRFTFTNENSETISGLYRNKELQINKSDIVKINKFSTEKTVTAVVFPIIIIAVIASQLSGSFDFEFNGNPNPI